MPSEENDFLNFPRLLGIAAALAAAVFAEQANAAGATLNEAACSALNGQMIAPARIGLPSGEAKITSALLTQPAPAGTNPQGQAAPAIPASCKVLGSIAPIDPAAPPINFQINLPINWNGKAVQYGGGGFNGVLITGLSEKLK